MKVNSIKFPDPRRENVESYDGKIDPELVIPVVKDMRSTDIEADFATDEKITTPKAVFTFVRSQLEGSLGDYVTKENLAEVGVYPASALVPAGYPTNLNDVQDQINCVFQEGDILQNSPIEDGNFPTALLRVYRSQDGFNSIVQYYTRIDSGETWCRAWQNSVWTPWIKFAISDGSGIAGGAPKRAFDKGDVEEVSTGDNQNAAFVTVDSPYTVIGILDNEDIQWNLPSQAITKTDTFSKVDISSVLADKDITVSAMEGTWYVLFAAAIEGGDSGLADQLDQAGVFPNVIYTTDAVDLDQIITRKDMLIASSSVDHAPAATTRCFVQTFIDATGTQGVQLFVSFADGSQWSRTRTAGVWGPWQIVPAGAEVDESRLLPENPANGDIPCYNADTDEWSKLNKSKLVLSVNGQSPDSEGSITIPDANQQTTGLLSATLCKELIERFTGFLANPNIPQLPASTDLNTLNKIGFYNVSNPVNGPDATGQYYLLVHRYGAGSTPYNWQLAYNVATSTLYTRQLNGTAEASSWSEVLTDNSPIATTSKKGLMAPADRVMLTDITARGIYPQAATVPEPVDFNTLLTPGNYFINGSPGHVNYPGDSDAEGGVLVVSGRGNYITQMFYSVNAGNIWTRHTQSATSTATFSDWYKTMAVGSSKNFTGISGIEFNGVAEGNVNGGYIDFHYAGSAADYTSRIIESESGKIALQAANGVSTSSALTVGGAVTTPGIRLNRETAGGYLNFFWGNNETTTCQIMEDAEGRLVIRATDYIAVNGIMRSGNEIQTVTGNGFRHVNAAQTYGVFTRADESSFYVMVTAQGQPFGSYTSARPIRIALSNGECYINGKLPVGTDDFTRATGTTNSNVIQNNYQQLYRSIIYWGYAWVTLGGSIQVTLPVASLQIIPQLTCIDTRTTVTNLTGSVSGTTLTIEVTGSSSVTQTMIGWVAIGYLS